MSYKPEAGLSSMGRLLAGHVLFSLSVSFFFLAFSCFGFTFHAGLVQRELGR